MVAKWTPEQIAAAEAKLGRKLYKREPRVPPQELILPSAVNGETWMARPKERAGRKFRVFRGGAVESNRRKH